MLVFAMNISMMHQMNSLAMKPYLVKVNSWTHFVSVFESELYSTLVECDV